MSTLSWKGEPCTELEYEAMTKLQPLAGDTLCACGHKRAFHISLLYADHDGCCSVVRCHCDSFVPDAVIDVGDAAPTR